VVNVEEVSR